MENGGRNQHPTETEHGSASAETDSQTRRNAASTRPPTKSRDKAGRHLRVNPSDSAIGKSKSHLPVLRYQGAIHVLEPGGGWRTQRIHQQRAFACTSQVGVQDRNVFGRTRAHPIDNGRDGHSTPAQLLESFRQKAETDEVRRPTGPKTPSEDLPRPRSTAGQPSRRL